MALSPGWGSALAGVVRASRAAGVKMSQRYLFDFLGCRCDEYIVHRIIDVADADGERFATQVMPFALKVCCCPCVVGNDDFGDDAVHKFGAIVLAHTLNLTNTTPSEPAPDVVLPPAPPPEP